MEKPNSILWNFTFIFFIFFSIFIAFKFVFIFFFRAAFEPRFIFELTPFYIFLGINNLQLLFLSLVVVVSDAYLHFKATRKNILYSFIPTLIMVSGLGLGIITKEISTDNLPHYLLFGFLLLVVLIDHRRTLMHPETLAAVELEKTEPLLQPSKPKPSLRKIKLPFFGKPKPEGVPTGKPKFSIPVASSLFSLFKKPKVKIRFKKGKKTSEPETEKETSEESKPVPFEAVDKEKETDVQVEEIKAESIEEGAPVKPEIEEEPSEKSKPTPSEEKEKRETDVHFGGAPSGGGGGVIPQFEAKKDIEFFKTDSYKHSPISSYKGDELGVGREFKPKEERLASPEPGDESKPSDIELKEEEFDKKSLDEIEEIFHKGKGEFEDKIGLEKKEIGLTAETQKPVIPKEDWETLREKIADRKREIKTKTAVIQDVQSDFKRIEGGLDSLKNKLENIGEEIQSTVQEMVVSGRKQEERRYYAEPVREISNGKISEPNIEPQERIVDHRRKSDLQRAQAILNELEKRVEKLESAYVYNID